MVRANYTPFRAKHVSSIKFGATAWSESDFTSTSSAIDTTFAANNGSILADLANTHTPDSVNPTKTGAFAKDFTESGGERSTTEENLLGYDSTGSQNQELVAEAASKVTVEFTLLYRNIVPTTLFSDSTRCCLIEMDNDESASTGQLNLGYNNISVTHVGSLTRNSDGFMEQKVKFEITGGTAGSVISVSQAAPAESWSRIRVGTNKVEEIRTA